MQKADFKNFTNEDYKAITKLEDRYTEAMKLLGYERVNADDEIVSIVFENGNNRIGFDG